MVARKISSAVEHPIGTSRSARRSTRAAAPVIPARQPDCQRRRDQLSVDDEPKMFPVPSQRCPRGSRIASLAPGSCSASAITFSAYDVDLSPPSHPARCAATAPPPPWSRARLQLVHDHNRGGVVAPPDPSAAATRVGDPQPARRQVLLGQHLDPRGRNDSASARDAEGGSEVAIRSQVSRQRERPALDRLDRLEDAVADGEPVVADLSAGASDRPAGDRSPMPARSQITSRGASESARTVCPILRVSIG